MNETLKQRKEIAKSLKLLADKLDNPKIFPKQLSFRCGTCGRLYSFGYVLRNISREV